MSHDNATFALAKYRPMGCLKCKAVGTAVEMGVCCAVAEMSLDILTDRFKPLPPSVRIVAAGRPFR